MPEYGTYCPCDKVIDLKDDKDYATLVHEIIHAIIHLRFVNKFKDEAEEEAFVLFLQPIITNLLLHNRKLVNYILTEGYRPHGKPTRRTKAAKTRKPGRPQRATRKSRQPRKPYNKPRVKSKAHQMVYRYCSSWDSRLPG